MSVQTDYYIPQLKKADEQISKQAERIAQLTEALRGIVTPALLGLIDGSDEEPKAMPDEAAVDVTGNGFLCQITVGDIRKASTALTAAKGHGL